MATTYTLISSVTVGSGGASTMDFTSIPSTYTDLCVKVSARGTGSYDEMYVGISFNGSTSNLTSRVLYGSGASAGSFSDTKIYGPVSANNTTANTFGSWECYVPNYAGSTNKSVSLDSVAETNGTSIDSYLTAGLWSNTAAITSISLYDAFTLNNFAQYSTAYLYGISNA